MRAVPTGHGPIAGVKGTLGKPIVAPGGNVKYKIALHRTEEGVAVSVPGLPGCWSQGETEAEAVANVREAIQEYLAARDELVRDSEVREIEVGG